VAGSPKVIDIESLLAPIPGAAPTGIDIREDFSAASPYFKLRDARHAARAAERRSDTEGENGALLAEWRTILDLAPKVLGERSKDLEVTAWLIEALVRSQGFAGLRDGLALTSGLVETYWDDLHSLADEEGDVTKVAPLAGLNGLDAEGTLIQPLRKVPLTMRGDDGPFAAYHYDQALALAQISDPTTRARREQAGAVTLERFNAAVNASGAPYYLDLTADLEGSIGELDRLSQLLDQKAGAAAPSTSAIRNALQTILEGVTRFSRDLIARARPAEPAAAAAAAAPASQPRGAGEGASFAGGPFRDREDALRVLVEVADYFGKYEPHSPISTTLQELVRRARLPFSQLLAELLPDTTAWRSALTSAGIKPPDAS